MFYFKNFENFFEYNANHSILKELFTNTAFVDAFKQEYLFGSSNKILYTLCQSEQGCEVLLLLFNRHPQMTQGFTKDLLFKTYNTSIALLFFCCTTGIKLLKIITENKPSLLSLNSTQISQLSLKELSFKIINVLGLDSKTTEKLRLTVGVLVDNIIAEQNDEPNDDTKEQARTSMRMF